MRRLLPNCLSILRILLTPVILIFVTYEAYFYALIALSVATLSDFLDGIFSRFWRAQTGIGTVLDPIGDKVLVVFILAYFFAMGDVPLWYFGTVILRDFCQLSGLIVLKLKKRGPAVWKPIFSGKLATAANVISLFLLIFASSDPRVNEYLPYYFVLAASLTMFTLVQYFGIWYEFAYRSNSSR